MVWHHHGSVVTNQLCCIHCIEMPWQKVLRARSIKTFGNIRYKYRNHWWNSIALHTPSKCGIKNETWLIAKIVLFDISEKFKQVCSSRREWKNFSFKNVDNVTILKMHNLNTCSNQREHCDKKINSSFSFCVKFMSILHYYVAKRCQQMTSS